VYFKLWLACSDGHWQTRPSKSNLASSKSVNYAQIVDRGFDTYFKQKLPTRFQVFTTLSAVNKDSFHVQVVNDEIVPFILLLWRIIENLGTLNLFFAKLNKNCDNHFWPGESETNYYNCKLVQKNSFEIAYQQRNEIYLNWIQSCKCNHELPGTVSQKLKLFFKCWIFDPGACAVKFLRS